VEDYAGLREVTCGYYPLVSTSTGQERLATQKKHAHKDEKRIIITKITKGQQFLCKNRILNT
jgi:hypothetical protein